MLYLLKPKEEENPIIKELTPVLGGGLIEGAKVHENSLILLTNYKKAYVIEDLSEIKARVICEMPYGISFILDLGEAVVSNERIKEIVVIDPSLSKYKDFEVIFPNPQGGLYRIYSENFEVIDNLGVTGEIKVGEALKLAITPFDATSKKNQVLAILTKDEEIIIAECDFENGKAAKTSLTDISVELPENITWCGIESVVLLYSTRLEILCKGNITAAFDFTDPKLDIRNFRGYYLYNEIDGMRILTNDCVYFIEKVSKSTEHVFDMIGANPSVQILDAYLKWLKKDPGADDALRGVKEEGEENLLEGINELIDAATHEFMPDNQKYLLKAASFAKNFLPFGRFDADGFVKVLKDLRIVNQLHVPKVK